MLNLKKSADRLNTQMIESNRQPYCLERVWLESSCTARLNTNSSFPSRQSKIRFHNSDIWHSCIPNHRVRLIYHTMDKLECWARVYFPKRCDCNFPKFETFFFLVRIFLFKILNFWDEKIKIICSYYSDCLKFDEFVFF